VCGLVLAGVLIGADPLARALAAHLSVAREELVFLMVVLAGGIAYLALVIAFFGRRFLAPLLRRRGGSLPPGAGG
jgi:putative peptidoglycan lipid II flippase